MKRTYFEGRPPWYDTTGSLKNPYVIGIAGGSASGKTSVCHEIVEILDVPWVSLISMDSFYKGLTPEQSRNASEYNFDHPDAFDFESLVNTIKTLKEGKSVSIPIYDFKTHSRSKQTETKYGADVIIVEGIFVLYTKQLTDLMDMKLFVDEEDDIRLARRLKRDIAERGRDIKGVLEQYEKFVKPAFDDYIMPTKKNADIIIPRGQSNKVAINLIAQHIKQQLVQRGWVPSNIKTAPKLKEQPPTVHVLKSNKQIDSIHTIIRDKEISRDDFVFYADRLSRLVIEHALQFLPSEDIPVETPTGAIYQGKRMYNKICALPIMRAGDSMVPALCSVVRNVKVGKILIQSDKNKTPKLFFFELPKDCDDHYFLVLDPLLGTGSTVTMAIRLLLDHNIPQEKIIFINMISSPQGVAMVTYTFPKVNIVTSAIDTTLSELGYILPGIGNFGDRYFGTDEEELDQEANKI